MPGANRYAEEGIFAIGLDRCEANHAPLTPILFLERTADVHPDALEISRHLSIAEARRRFPQIRGYPLIQSGDVHRLEEFLGANRFTLAAPTIAELRLALAGQAGRALAVGEPVGAI